MVVEVFPAYRPQSCCDTIHKEPRYVLSRPMLGLRANLRAGLRDKVDEQILNRGTDGLLTFGTEPTSPTAESTAAQYLAAVASGVDGRFAMNKGEVKALVGSTIYGHMAGQDVGTNSGTTVTDKLGNRVRVSPHVAAYASNYQEAVVCKGSAFQAVCAIWQGVPIEVADRGLEGRTRRGTAVCFLVPRLRNPPDGRLHPPQVPQ